MDSYNEESLEKLHDENRNSPVTYVCERCGYEVRGLLSGAPDWLPVSYSALGHVTHSGCGGRIEKIER